MSDWVLGITTYQKTDALKTLLVSLIDNGYDKESIIHVADDNAGQPYTLYKNVNSAHPCWENNPGTEETMASAPDIVKYLNKYYDTNIKISFGKEARVGIAKNKNRNINYFLNKTKAKYLILIDDDLCFHKPGMLKDLEEVLEVNNINHVTGFWSEKGRLNDLIQLSGLPWHQDFPVEAQGHKITWHKGCQGVLQVYTRKCIETIGYYDNDLKGKYGYEHDIHSSRAYRAVDKRCPFIKAQYTRCNKFYHGQAIPNNYFDSGTEIAKISEQHAEKINKIAWGFEWRVPKTGLDLTTETVIE